MMFDTHLVKEEYDRRVREAEKAYQHRVVARPGRLSLTFKSLLALVARF